MLQELGFQNAYALRGGFQDWQAAGYPVESGPPETAKPKQRCPICGQEHAA